MRDAGELAEVDGRFFYTGTPNPTVGVSLRHMSDNTFSIVLRKQAGATGFASDSHAGRSSDGTGTASGTQSPHDNFEVIANVDSISAPELVYPEAVYLHNGESYFVRQLDLEGKVAYVERHEMDYYTQAVLESAVKITQPRDERDAAGRDVPFSLAYGDVDVTWQTVAFKKIKFGTRENIGQGPVNIPAQTLATTAFWLSPTADVRAQMKSERLRATEGLVGLRNLAVVALPLVAMCDSRDLGGVVDSTNLGHSTLIVYDRYPGGLGYSERGFARIDELLRICHELLADCECEQGCPSCVGLPNLRPAIHSDPDLTRGYPMPNKRATLRLLELLREGIRCKNQPQIHANGRKWGKDERLPVACSYLRLFAIHLRPMNMLSDEVLRRLGELNREPLPAAERDEHAPVRCNCIGRQRVWACLVRRATWLPDFSRIDAAHVHRDPPPPLPASIYTVTRHCDRRSLPPIEPLESEHPSGKHLIYQRRVSDYVELTTPGAPADSELNVRPNKRARSELARVREAFPQGVLLLDLETCGLGSAMIFLVGVIRQCGDELVVEQLLARSYNEERPILETLWGIASEAKSLVTFNGKSFDWPLVQDRTTYHRMGRSAHPSMSHCDLLHHARRRWRHVLPNCKLQTLERAFCGRGRVDDIPGQRIPQAYHDFVRTGQTHELESILHHNALDLVTLLELTLLLIGDDRTS